VVATADDAARWAPLVTDRNASGQRTALLTADPGDDSAEARAATMAEEIFMGAPFVVVETRGGA
ncbi:MAG: hypothetical protein KY395_04840, partial [Actinobacteria bacterium]|nr:hypothetical protein [Actinomycetota bacterium]